MPPAGPPLQSRCPHKLNRFQAGCSLLLKSIPAAFRVGALHLGTTIPPLHTRAGLRIIPALVAALLEPRFWWSCPCTRVVLSTYHFLFSFNESWCCSRIQSSMLAVPSSPEIKQPASVVPSTLNKMDFEVFHWGAGVCVIMLSVLNACWWLSVALVGDAGLVVIVF